MSKKGWTAVEAAEAVGLLADRCDSLLGAMQLPLPPAMHLDALRGSLTEMRRELRAIAIGLGLDPETWDDTTATDGEEG